MTTNTFTPFMSSKSRYAPILHTCCNHLLQDKMKISTTFLDRFLPNLVPAVSARCPR